MPRTARASVGGVCYHVLDRGNGRARVFHDADDYGAFLGLVGRACERLPLRVLAWCLMPNHLHLVLWPHGDGDLGRWMHWLLTSHVRRHHRLRHTSGHIWQGRFKAFPIQADGHLLTVLRYVEGNAVRAGLADRAEAWPWSSAAARDAGERPPWLVDGPVPRPTGWLRWVNQPLSEREWEGLRRSVVRGTPWGEAVWAAATARRLGLEFTLRPRGRPRKESEK
jgi:putative transposase